MGFLKSLFSGKVETPEEQQKEDLSKNFDVLKYDGVRALRSGELTYAIQCFEHALELQDDLETRDYLSQAFIQSDNLPQACEQLQKLAEAQPENVQVLVRIANVQFMMEDYNAMNETCEQALLIDKDNPLLLFLYARACIGQGDLSNGIALLTKTIAVREDYGDAYLLRGETLLEMGDTEGADEDATWLMEQTEGIEEVLMLKARIEEKKGNKEEAEKYYEQVKKVNPFAFQ